MIEIFDARNLPEERELSMDSSETFPDGTIYVKSLVIFSVDGVIAASSFGLGEFTITPEKGESVSDEVGWIVHKWVFPTEGNL